MLTIKRITAVLLLAVVPIMILVMFIMIPIAMICKCTTFLFFTYGRMITRCNKWGNRIFKDWFAESKKARRDSILAEVSKLYSKEDSSD